MVAIEPGAASAVDVLPVPPPTLMLPLISPPVKVSCEASQ